MVWTAFGELAILYNCTRTASVRGKGKSVLESYSFFPLKSMQTGSGWSPLPSSESLLPWWCSWWCTRGYWMVQWPEKWFTHLVISSQLNTWRFCTSTTKTSNQGMSVFYSSFQRSTDKTRINVKEHLSCCFMFYALFSSFNVRLLIKFFVNKQEKNLRSK